MKLTGLEAFGFNNEIINILDVCVGVDTERSHDNNYLHIPMYFFDCDLDGVNKPNYFARCITPQINLHAGTYNANRMRRAFPEEIKAGRRLYKTAADIEWRKSLDVERMTVYKCDFIEPEIYINVLDPLHRHVGVKHVGVDLGESPELSEIKELNKELERWNSNQKKTIQDQDSEIKSLKDLLHKVLTHEQTSMSPILAMEVNQVLGPMYRLMGENGFNRRRTFDLFREKLEKGHIHHGVIKVDTGITPQTHPQAFCKHFTITLQGDGISQCNACGAFVDSNRKDVRSFIEKVEIKAKTIPEEVKDSIRNAFGWKGSNDS